MIKMPYEEIVSRIKEEAGLTDEQLQIRIKQKMDQLSGLISKEGAAHIIANDLGVTLIEKTSGKLQVKNIMPGMRNVEVVGKAVAVYEVRTFQRKDGEGKVGSFMLADETGQIRAVCWGDQADTVSKLGQGDVVKVTGGYAKENQGRLELHLNERSKVEINPEGEKVEAVAAPKKPSMERKKISELTPEDQNVELLGTIVQVFDIRFFEIDPSTGRKPKEPIDNPDYGYVLNIFLDDGTDSIRTAFFRQQVDALTGKSKEEIMTYREMPEKFEEVKHTLLGNIIKVQGRANKNDMFDRLEFMVNDVDTNPDPEEELKKMGDSPETEEKPDDSSDLTAEEIEKALKD